MTSHLYKSHPINILNLAKTKALKISSLTIDISNYSVQSTNFLPDLGSNPYAIPWTEKMNGWKGWRSWEGGGAWLTPSVRDHNSAAGCLCHSSRVRTQPRPQPQGTGACQYTAHVSECVCTHTCTLDKSPRSCHARNTGHSDIYYFSQSSRGYYQMTFLEETAL